MHENEKIEFVDVPNEIDSIRQKTYFIIMENLRG